MPQRFGTVKTRGVLIMATEGDTETTDIVGRWIQMVHRPGTQVNETSTHEHKSVKSEKPERWRLKPVAVRSAKGQESRMLT